MASRNPNLVESLEQEVRLIGGQFSPSGSSATPAINVGLGYSVSRTLTGTFPLTFTNAWPVLESFIPQMQLTGTVSGSNCPQAQIGPITNFGTNALPTVTIYVVDPATGNKVDIPPGPSNRIHFLATVRNRKLP